MPDARVPLWEKFVYLAPFAGFTGAARQPIGVVWAEEETRDLFPRLCRSRGRGARGRRSRDARLPARFRAYVDGVPPRCGRRF